MKVIASDTLHDRNKVLNLVDTNVKVQDINRFSSSDGHRLWYWYPY
ncbi:hypothetical protein [Nostoc sp.]